MLALAPDDDRPPAIPCYAGIYLSNLWYGHQIILIEHMGLDPARVALPGKLQNGWQPGTGLDGEQGMRLEVTHGRDPFYVWGRRALGDARAAGLDWGVAIGAPFLYLRAKARSKPKKDTLLAFPTHSVSDDMIVTGWAEYADDLVAFARAEGFAHVVVCLGFRDWTDTVAGVFAEREVRPVCLGGIFNRRFLNDFVDLVDRATAVVSDRACSAGFYAMHLGRPFQVRGQPLMSPGNDLGPAGDPSWLATNVPEVNGRFSASRRVADRELGAEFVRDPEELFACVFRPGFQRWGMAPGFWPTRPNWEDTVTFRYPEAG